MTPNRKSLLSYGTACAFVVLAGDGPPNAFAQEGPTVTVLAQGGPLHGSNGILFGPDGNLYIASVVSSAILAIDPESGAIVSRWDADDGVNGPDDLAFGPDGSVYWTDIAVGEVGKRTPAGVTSIVGAPGPGANPITLSDDGRLFVSQCFLDDHLFEIDPDGVDEPRLINDELGPGCGLNGMDWGPDGKLYGPRWFRGEVARVDVDSGAVETVATGFRIPAAVKFDSEGRLHVLDTQAGEVVRLDLASGTREVVGRPGTGVDNLALDRDDRVFVSSFMDGSIVEVTGPDTNRQVLPSHVNSPGGIAYTPEGRLFLADGAALRELDPSTGESIHAAGALVTDVGQAMSVHPHGEHLVLSSPTTVTVWDPGRRSGGRARRGFRRGGRRHRPRRGHRRERVRHGQRGALRRGVAGRTDGAGERTLRAGRPSRCTTGTCTWRTGAARSCRFSTTARRSQRRARWRAACPGPEGIAAADDGSLYVVEVEAGRVTRVDAESGAATAVVEGLALSGPERRALGGTTSVGELAGIATGDGVLFVSAYRDNRVYRIEP